MTETVVVRPAEPVITKATLAVFMAILGAIVVPMYGAWQRDVSQVTEQVKSGYVEQIEDCRGERNEYRNALLKNRENEDEETSD